MFERVQEEAWVCRRRKSLGLAARKTILSQARPRSHAAARGDDHQAVVYFATPKRGQARSKHTPLMHTSGTRAQLYSALGSNLLEQKQVLLQVGAEQQTAARRAVARGNVARVAGEDASASGRVPWRGKLGGWHLVGFVMTV